MKAADTRPLGRTGLEVTLVSYGGGSLGNFYRRIGNADAHAILDAAWNEGIRYFDTAPVYGRGRSERRLGMFLGEKPRDEYVLSSMVGRLMVPARGEVAQDGIFLDPAPFNSRWDYSYDGVLRSHEESLQRLGLDRIDILYVHDIGRRLHGDAADEQMRIFRSGGLKALEQLVGSGAIAGYGLGVTEVDVCVDMLDYANPEAFLLAGPYTLLDHAAAKPLLDRCLKRRVSLAIGGVFASGILATGAVPGARYDYAPADPDILDRVRKLEYIAASHGVMLSAAALQFPLAHPAVATVLLGAGRLSSLEQGIGGIEAHVSPAFWRDLCEQGLVDPGCVPGAQAP
ncbi:MAG: aldo/keto reductase [Novosphingobium sp.]|nr:aldo/keto reductase [Novosphingobium sp.]